MDDYQIQMVGFLPDELTANRPFLKGGSYRSREWVDRVWLESDKVEC